MRLSNRIRGGGVVVGSFAVFCAIVAGAPARAQDAQARSCLLTIHADATELVGNSIDFCMELNPGEADQSTIKSVRISTDSPLAKLLKLKPVTSSLDKIKKGLLPVFRVKGADGQPHDVISISAPGVSATSGGFVKVTYVSDDKGGTTTYDKIRVRRASSNGWELANNGKIANTLTLVISGTVVQPVITGFRLSER